MITNTPKQPRSSFVLFMIVLGVCLLLLGSSEALQLSLRSSSSQQQAQEQQHFIQATSPQISYRNGRFLRDRDAIVFDWSGFVLSTQFTFQQNASLMMNSLKMMIHMNDPGNLYNCYLWRMNGDVRVKLLQENVLTTVKGQDAFGLEFSWALEKDSQSYGVEIELEKRSEAMLGVVEFYGITFLQAVQQLPKKEMKIAGKSKSDEGLKIEFIGDSITCAYGNMGKAPCVYTPATQNVHESFVEKTARIVNATEIHIECWSGKGVVRNFADKNSTSVDPFPVYYPRTLANDPKTSWQFTKTFVPDIAVITLGTNDFSTAPRPSYEDFSNGYQKFLDFIFGKYAGLKGPSFKIVMVSVVATENYGDYIQNIAEKQPGYGKTVFFANLRDVWRGFGPNDWGCSGHPNESGDEKLALALSSFLSKNVL